MDDYVTADANVAKMTSRGGFGSWRHLSARFFSAVVPLGPSPGDESWALDHLLPGEQTLWRRMSGPDRRHAVGVARETIRLLQPRPTSRDVIAAALLHDVGKIEASFGTFTRVGVTCAALAGGRSRLLRWADNSSGNRRRFRTRVKRYLTHDRLGADLLERAGSDTLTVLWAAEHHLAPSAWSVDTTVGTALKAADGD